MRTYSIRELGEEFGITARTLRFYEDKGLISPTRQGVTRVFSERDKVRLDLTLRGKRLGFSLEEIRKIIDMYDPGQPHDPAQIIYLCRKIQEHRKELINKIKDINDTLYLMNEVESGAMKALGAQYDTVD
ncbi:MAG: MerR family transcriptional regulator [Gammaproteobacteria bacterium]